MKGKLKAAVMLFAATIFALSAATAAGTDVATKPWSVRMVESEMARNPKTTDLDFMNGVLKWNYTTGLELEAFLDVYDRYDDERIWNYAVSYYDTIINEKGQIHNYKMENFNLDHVCPGRTLFRIYERTGDVKYRRTLRTLREQLEKQPRTSDGGFWHKKVYPYQMWLDGLYMGSPFYAQYASRFEDKATAAKSYDDIAHEFVVVAKHTCDPASRLYRHAWDEKRVQPWADPVTGQSQHVWGRALGWYVMAIVDVLDYLPEKHPGRKDMIEILQGIYRELPRYADKQSGMWYQVLEQPDREGNYQEATASAMFVYGMLKGVRKGYLDSSLKEGAVKNYQRFIDRFVRENPDGTIRIIDCCAVAGLGGKNNRDGSFEYYMSEPVRDNDPKGVSPFIWASLEMEHLANTEYTPEGWNDRPVAFPGAEGGGKYTTGGRGGKVIHVTKLTDDGSEGTLRHAVEQEGPRTILFKVSGDIVLSRTLEIKNGDLTIAGQSAPGDGVCVRDYGVRIKADNVIVRYMRFRMGDQGHSEADALDGVRHKNIIVDHCTMSWSTDECASFYCNNNFTMQWCIISESLNSSVHSKGNHGYGAIWGGRNATFHHNLLAHHNSRNPRLDHTTLYPNNYIITHRGTVEYVNNVVYNWGGMAMYGGEEGWWNVAGNYYTGGPASKKADKQFMEATISSITAPHPGTYYLDANVLEGAAQITADNWKGVDFKGDFTAEQIKRDAPWPTKAPIKVEAAEAAYTKILDQAGASHKRDAVDERIVGEVKKRTTTYKGSIGGLPGIIDTQGDVGGWPTLKTATAPADSDGDGMPDKWEKKNRLNPNNPEDGKAYTLDKTGSYTNLEMYLNGIVKK